MTERPSDLVELLADLLGQEIVDLEVRRSRYSTSAPIDDITVTVADGTTLTVVRKDLGRAALLPGARRWKPAFLHDPARELGAYAHVLPWAPAGPASCVGVVDDPDGGRTWLLLERVDGVELFQVGDIERWQAAARWIARFHDTFTGRAADVRAAGVPLLHHDRAWLRTWVTRADDPSGRLRSVGEVLADRLAELPTTVVHGELYASNVIVGAGAAPRVSVVDWEMIAEGPGLADLAALTSGRWSDAERRAIEAAYAAEAGRAVDAGFATELDLCRLALCVQWLGWQPGWSPPEQHRHDWQAEALALIERLSL